MAWRPCQPTSSDNPPEHTYGPVTYPGTLQSVSAVSASDVWAVGFHDVNEVSSTLIEHWDGHFWSLVESPHFGGSGGSQLYGVSALSTSDAWAVGNYYIGSEFDTLIEHWDGTAWSQVPSPSPGGTTGNYLFSVSALSSNDVWAVGRTYDGPLIEHWDGNVWSVVASPGSVGTGLSGVTAISSTNAYAAGNTFGPFSRPFILQWDGAQWNQLSLGAPAKRGFGDELAGVSASSASDIWAVGTRTAYRRVRDSALVEHFDGTNWLHVASLNPGGRHGTQLNAVTALSAHDVWAVGSFGTRVGGGTSRTFIEHWNGTRWTRMHTAHPGSNHVSVVTGVDAISSSRAFTSGTFVDGTYRTMTMNWDGKRWIQL